MEGQGQSPIPKRKPKRKARRRSIPPLPAQLRKEIARLSRELNRQHRKLLMADPKLKDRLAGFSDRCCSPGRGGGVDPEGPM
jgi:hypothetical protein